MRQLLLISALEEAGNIHAAARLLNMTQPAASKLLKELEDMLEVPLFERLPRGMRPTWYGETMIRHAREALTTLGQAHDELAALKIGRYGTVSLGAITSPGLTLLPQVVSSVKRDHPGLLVRLEVDNSPALIERLNQGHLDIALARFLPGEDQTHLSYEPIGSEPICAVARRGHPLSLVSKLELAELVNCSWIVPPLCSVLRHRFDLMFREHDMKPPLDIVETASLLFITRMLEQSDMLCVMAAEVGRYYAAHGILSILPLEMACDVGDFGLVTRTDRMLSPSAQLVMAAIKFACRPTGDLEVDYPSGRP